MGRVRTNNEDALCAQGLGTASAKAHAAGDPPETTGGSHSLERPGAILAVADGMGGAKAGEVASGMAVSILGEEMAHRAEEGLPTDASHADLHRIFESAVHLANERIRDEGTSNPSRSGMGTTLTAAWVIDDIALLVHVGDSRAYLFRKGNLSQVTRDQSLVQKLLEDNIISAEEAERMAARNIILQALGSEEDLDVAVPTVALEAEDTLLLCTDGLTGVIKDGVVETILRRGGPLEDMCARLVTAAEEGGGPDNITVILGRIEPAHGAV